MVPGTEPIYGHNTTERVAYLVVGLHLEEFLLEQDHPECGDEYENSVSGVAKHQREQERKAHDRERR